MESGSSFHHPLSLQYTACEDAGLPAQGHPSPPLMTSTFWSQPQEMLGCQHPDVLMGLQAEAEDAVHSCDKM